MNDLAHAYVGLALGGKHDWDGDINEEREALRLNPNNDFCPRQLGCRLGRQG